ncbi:MAG: hypothetical protein U0236_13775 [Nitrospira sp.]
MDGRLEPRKISASDTFSVGTSPSSAIGSVTGESPSDTMAPASATNFRIEPSHGYILNDPLGQHPILIKDPLSEVTRRERKAFLGLSVLAIAVMKANLIPSELSAFGVKIDNIKREWLIALLTAVVLYFLVVFMAYAFSDYLGWRIAFWEAVRARAIEREKVEKDIVEGEDNDSEEVTQCYRHQRALSAKAIPTSFIRAFIDFVLPIFVGIAALIVLRGCA